LHTFLTFFDIPTAIKFAPCRGREVKHFLAKLLMQVTAALEFLGIRITRGKTKETGFHGDDDVSDEIRDDDSTTGQKR
jgi:hypothetical protein